MTMPAAVGAAETCETVTLRDNRGEVVSKLLEIKLLLVTELEDGAMGARVGKDGVQM